MSSIKVQVFGMFCNILFEIFWNFGVFILKPIKSGSNAYVPVALLPNIRKLQSLPIPGCNSGCPYAYSIANDVNLTVSVILTVEYFGDSLHQILQVWHLVLLLLDGIVERPGIECNFDRFVSFDSDYHWLYEDFAVDSFQALNVPIC